MSEQIFPMSDPFSSPQRLSQSLVQASQELGLVRAEVGRILGYKCEQFTAIFEGRSVLEGGTHAYRQAELLVRLYQLLYQQMPGDRARMIHWLRRQQRELGNAPFYLIVDEGRLAEVVAFVERQGGA